MSAILDFFHYVYLYIYLYWYYFYKYNLSYVLMRDTKSLYLINPLWTEFFFFVVFRDITLDRLFSSTDS